MALQSKRKTPIKSVLTFTRSSGRSIWPLFSAHPQNEYLYERCENAQSLSCWNRINHQKKKKPTLGHCTLQRTSLSSWVCGDSYRGDWNTHKKKAAKWNCQALKKWQCFKRFFIWIFFIALLSLLSSSCLSPTRERIRIHMCRVYRRPRTCTGGRACP